jgi:hypothetical protein
VTAPTSIRSSFASAALRHVRDAEHLAAAGEHTSRDQAWHLIGFGPECARKAMFVEGWVAKALGHELTDFGDELAAWVAALEPLPHRYRAHSAARELAALKSWRADVRYEATGTIDAARRNLTVALVEAATFVHDRVAELWSDGLVELDGADL